MTRKRRVQPQEIKEINVNDPEFPAFAANFFEPGGLSAEEIIEAINATPLKEKRDDT